MATFSERFRELAPLAIEVIPEKCRIYQQFGDFSLLGNREM